MLEEEEEDRIGLLTLKEKVNMGIFIVKLKLQ